MGICVHMEKFVVFCMLGIWKKFWVHVMLDVVVVFAFGLGHAFG